MIGYKAQLRNCVVVVANRFFPAVKPVPICGKIKPYVSLADRNFICACRFSADRDLNAALNLNPIRSGHVTAETLNAHKSTVLSWILR
ncbi:hypothetical protein CKO12_06585 [Chromatium okenii]|uniref:zinc ribbon domain-containing protein n=1 Tax=Chromatium okenii TaxID=61644 RepID=UPI0019050340|nr:hypothetical protein [Chromatium okenii]